MNQSDCKDWDLHIAPHRDKFLSKRSAKQYLGFAESQRMRLTGERGMGRHGQRPDQRPDLVEKYGFDVKFAMHYIRLLYECRELLKEKKLTLPRPDPERTHLIEIRTGKYTQDEVFAVGRDFKEQCESLLAISDLPEMPDIDEVSRMISSAYLQHWRERGLIAEAGPL